LPPFAKWPGNRFQCAVKTNVVALKLNYEN
jgi:hypothetical protein